MTPRSRRFAVALLLLVVMLFAGRWSVGFVAERWWAATISPAAAAFVSHWRLLGLALDAGAIIVASVWFALQALLVARAIESVQVTRNIGNLQLREAVPMRLLLGAALISGILLGLIAGSGAHEWRNPVILAMQGVTYGVLDPLLSTDVGVLVAQLPLWDLVHRMATLLAVLGLTFCVMLYASIGAMRWERRRIDLHLDARRHLGVLLAVVALTIFAGYQLSPYHLAAASLPTLTGTGAQTRIRAAEIMSGVAIATTILSLVWALRGRNALLLGAWLVLGLGAITERYAVPALVEEAPPVTSRLAMMRRFDAIAWGIREAPATTAIDTVPAVTALWDEAILARFAESGGGALEGATRGDVIVDGRAMPAWFVATAPPGAPSHLEVLAIADGIPGPAGAPLLIRSQAEATSVRPVWRTINEARVRPMSPSWRTVTTGVSATSPLRRLLLAWARQAPGLLGARVRPDIDWHLDPVERAAAVLPMLSWLDADVVMIGGRPSWLVQGMITIAQFPMSARSHWRNDRVAGVVPAVVCTIDAASGETHFYSDPAADSLGVAWARVVGPLVASSGTMPQDVRHALGYPGEWLRSQVSVLQGPAWNSGKALTLTSGVTPVPLWIDAITPARQVTLNDVGSAVTSNVATAYRRDGMPELRLDRRDPDLADARVELRQLWNRAAVLAHLKDSATAAGDTVWSAATRWQGGKVLAAWQTVFAVPRRGTPALLWIATTIGDRIGGAPTPGDAWKSATQAGVPGAHAPDDATALETARRAMEQADSAFRRGDMTAFGRAFEEVRRALKGRPR